MDKIEKLPYVYLMVEDVEEEKREAFGSKRWWYLSGAAGVTIFELIFIVWAIFTQIGYDKPSRIVAEIVATIIIVGIGAFPMVAFWRRYSTLTETREAIANNPFYDFRIKLSKTIDAFNERVKVYNHWLEGIEKGLIDDDPARRESIGRNLLAVRDNLSKGRMALEYFEEAKQLAEKSGSSKVSELADSLIDLDAAAKRLNPQFDIEELSEKLDNDMLMLEAANEVSVI